MVGRSAMPMIEIGTEALDGAHERRQRAADFGDVVARRLRVVDEDRDRHRRGCRTDAEHFARPAVFAHGERIDTEPRQRRPRLFIPGADVKHALVGLGQDCDRQEEG
jgi:hypothetical protein